MAVLVLLVLVVLLGTLYRVEFPRSRSPFITERERQSARPARDAMTARTSSSRCPTPPGSARDACTWNDTRVS
jgi:hypothetical protein